MATEPMDLERQDAEFEGDMASSDEDAEHEDDPMMDQEDLDGNAGEQQLDLEGSDADAEGEDVDEDEELVGDVKIPNQQDDSESEADAAEEAGSDHDDSSDNEESSDAESDVAEEEWVEGSDGGEEEEAAGTIDRNCCIFCGEDEEHDPSEEFEEYLACAVCGDNSHRQCARSASGVKPDEDAAHWRCPSCIENGLEIEQNDMQSSHRRSSAPKIARDLLPSLRGAPRPDSHSVFNSLIVDDDPMDGSRLLRKRKASSVEISEAFSVTRKRRRPSKLTDSDSQASDLPESTDHYDDVEVGDNENGNEEREFGKDEFVDEEIPATNGITRDPSNSPKARPSRPRRPRKVDTKLATIAKRNKSSIILRVRLDSKKLSRVLESQPKKKRRRPQQTPVAPEQHVHYPSFFSANYATPFYSFHDRGNDSLNSKPYGGILSEAEADTSKTLPQAADRARFEAARQKAEEEWKQKIADTTANQGENEGRSQKVAGPPSKIKCINFGGFEIDTWYAAPYPEEYSRNRVLYICEFCLKYMSSDFVAWRHKLKCPAKHPPGDEIYRDKSVSIFEVDGRKNPVYCQNLCLLAKLFLGSKTLYYDVEPFLFYVMTEYDEYGCHFVGYFSKEKRPSSQNNVSCILTLPTHQRKGYGNLLIDFSYLLSRVERKTGSPEKPLSDMGLVSYRNYWRLVLSYQLLEQKDALSITDISARTGMTADDIVSGLENLRALVRDPVTKTYGLRLDFAYFQQCIDSWEAKGYVKLNSDALVWTPYIMGRSNLAHYETAPPLATVAPREGEEDEEKVAPEEGVQAAQDVSATREVIVGSNRKVNGDGHDKHDGVPTPQADTEKQLQQAAGPPPSTDVIDHAILKLVAKPSPSKPVSNPPKVNGLQPPAIPPIRFEIFPPVPGSARRRAAKRASARGVGRRTSTPVRRGGKNLDSITPSTKLSTRTRSKLADMLTDDNEEKTHTDYDGKTVEVVAVTEIENGHKADFDNGASAEAPMDEA
ncbi:MAG: hypothetical protein M1819_005587 [Sarea resinae]|nr:MAG: hypothetical protein M1819_005587 [Sarea resinae]